MIREIGGIRLNQIGSGQDYVSVTVEKRRAYHSGFMFVTPVRLGREVSEGSMVE